MKNHNPDYISKHDMSGMTWAEYVNKEVFENMVLNNLFTTVEEYLKTEAQNVEESGSSGVFPLDEESFEKIFKVVKWRCLSIHIIRDLIFLQNYHNKKIRKFLEQCRNDTPSSDLGWDTGRVDGLLAPLHVACIYNSLRIVQRFIEVEYNVNVTDQYQCTPLYYNVIQFSQEPDASRDDKLAIAKLLLSNGADITQPDRGCGTMLYSAVRSRNIDIVEMLIGHVNSTKIPKITKKEYMNMQNRDSSSPLHLVIQNGDINIVKLLLDEGADPNLADKYDEISLHAAVNAGNLDVIEELLRRGADINRKNISNRAPLQFAAEKGNTEVLRMLLEQEWINIENDCVDAACFSAIFGGNPDLMNLLLDRITDVNVTAKNGDTLLHTAVLHRKLNIAALLMERGANKNAKNKWGNTPLYCAVASENKDMVELLLVIIATRCGSKLRKRKRAQVNDWGIEQEVPASLLREAVIIGKTEIIEISSSLLNKGLDCNVKFENGKTALHVAVCIGKLDVIKLLVEKGGDVNCKDSEDRTGQTPIDIAVNSRSTDIIKVLRPEGIHK
ncbi:Ankyrin repeats (3 copies) [Popillia japonica]|uniref:Ankyrin repeats (3 copies) n=1 Tax=Popillia japonica TaxID=7064 RepID=A0AAW1MXB9_POPJA